MDAAADTDTEADVDPLVVEESVDAAEVALDDVCAEVAAAVVLSEEVAAVVPPPFVVAEDDDWPAVEPEEDVTRPGARLATMSEMSTLLTGMVTAV